MRNDIFLGNLITIFIYMKNNYRQHIGLNRKQQ
jgi:hypothetical protein